jgi:hypothetical protein
VAGVRNSIWVGLNDLDREYFYQWIDGVDVSFTNWDVNMPASNPTREQHCVAMNNQVSDLAPSKHFSAFWLLVSSVAMANF